MTVSIYLAPAGAGKTHYAVAEARRQAKGLGATPHVLVASALQAQAFRRRLAQAGGAIGVPVLTFEQLYQTALSTTDAACCKVEEPVQHRVIRSVVRELPLVHYAPLVERPGFIRALQDVIAQLKAGRVHPQSFAEAIAAHGNPARLRELADIYAAYQDRLQAEGWADAAGMGWLTVEALEGGASQMGMDWPLLLVDGFDDFTPVQLAILALLASRVERTVITLTGTLDDRKRSLAHRRFDRTRQELVEVLGVEPAPLPNGASAREPALNHLEAGLFRSEASQTDCQGTVDLIEAVNRAEEVRAALRWLKTQVVEHGVSPGDVALLARDVTPYRPFIRQIAAEFGLAERSPAPVHIYAGRPLGKNPAVAALLDLLRLMLPASEGTGVPTAAGEGAEPALRPRAVVKAWRSPYFDWSATIGRVSEGSAAAEAASATVPGVSSPSEEAGPPIGIEPGDAEALGAIARRGRVIAGLAQWEAAFEALQGTEERGSTVSEATPIMRTGSGATSAMRTESGATSPKKASEAPEAEEGEGEASPMTPSRPPGPGRRVLDLRDTFRRFVRRLTPPQGHHSAREFVRWLETLIGPDPERGSDRFPQPETPTSLNVVARIRMADEDGDEPFSLVERDLAALRCLKRVLRGLVWAEEALDDPPMAFPKFVRELTGALEATFYRLPRHLDREEILVADVVAARGVPFQAVAVLGLAEGFFPAVQSEDPLLWDDDREALDLPLEPSTRSAEAEYVYETVAAPSQRLLLTRPRLTDDGAPWQASPFWEEIRRLVDAEPITLSALPGPRPDRAASWPELLQSAGASEADALWAWLRENSPASTEALDAAAQILTWRQNRVDSPFDGGLHELRDHFTSHFHAGHTWSATRLEAYRTCPFFFFVSKVLALEPREEPTEGIDWLQRGNLYHKILERVYRSVDDPTDLEQLLAALPAIADSVLDEAPERQGFRPTAWWAQTRRELVEDVRRSLEALSQVDPPSPPRRELVEDVQRSLEALSEVDPPSPPRRELVEDVQRSLEALSEVDPPSPPRRGGLRGGDSEEQRAGFVPIRYEAAFGLEGEPPLIVPDPAGEDAFKLRGLIDRVDRDAEGRVRIIDYKTGGPSGYGNAAIRDGEKLQLPLYALAARDALELGQPLSGFYWHVRHAEPSPFKLEDFGPEEAIRTALAHAWEAIHGAREGHFTPQAPPGGCPRYCPAATFCWHYEPRYRG